MIGKIFFMHRKFKLQSAKTRSRLGHTVFLTNYYLLISSKNMSFLYYSGNKYNLDL